MTHKFSKRTLTYFSTFALVLGTSQMGKALAQTQVSLPSCFASDGGIKDANIQLTPGALCMDDGKPKRVDSDKSCFETALASAEANGFHKPCFHPVTEDELKTYTLRTQIKSLESHCGNKGDLMTDADKQKLKSANGESTIPSGLDTSLKTCKVSNVADAEEAFKIRKSISDVCLEDIQATCLDTLMNTEEEYKSRLTVCSGPDASAGGACETAMQSKSQASVSAAAAKLPTLGSGLGSTCLGSFGGCYGGFGGIGGVGGMGTGIPGQYNPYAMPPPPAQAPATTTKSAQ